MRNQSTNPHYVGKNHVTSVYHLSCANLYCHRRKSVQLKDEFLGVKFQENVAHVHSSSNVTITSPHPGHIPEGFVCLFVCFTKSFFKIPPTVLLVITIYFYQKCVCSVAKSRLTLCNSMDF